MNVMMNLVVELNLSSRSLLPIERKKSIYVKRSDVNSKEGYTLDILGDSHAQQLILLPAVLLKAQ